MDLKNKNTIDVIIPAYNEEKFAIRAIESVVNQTLKPNKIIVVDDGSTDNSIKVIENYVKDTNIPIIILRKENGGPNSARNAGIKESSAEFLAFLDADDVWEPQKLEKQIEKFNENKFSNLGLVYTKYQHIDSKDKISGIGLVKLDKNFSGMAFDYVISANKILGSASSVLIKKSVFDNVGLFDEDLKFAEDWDMWIRIAEKYEIDFVDEILVNIRVHDKNRTKNYKNNFEGEIDFFNKWIPKIKSKSIPLEWKDRILSQIVRNMIKQDFRQILREKMTPEVYNQLFPNGISYFMIFSFIIKKLALKLIKK